MTGVQTCALPICRALDAVTGTDKAVAAVVDLLAPDAVAVLADFAG